MVNLYTNFPLLKYNTFGMDVQAARFIEYDSVDDLKQVLASFAPDELFLQMGGGSNLLFIDNYPGTVLHSRIKGREVVKEDEDYVWLRAGAGEVWDELVAYCVENGWGGVENLSLIPGEVGASAVQNIGAYGVEAKDLITKVETIVIATRNERSFSAEECAYAYRKSIFKEELKGQYIVTYVTYRLSKQPAFHLDYGNIWAELEKQGGEITLSTIRDIVIAIRQAKLPDPTVQGNAGSFFMNPIIERSHYEALLEEYPSMPHYDVDESHVKVPAAWMIDQCGWKGRSLGRAGVHDKQALVLVNKGGATGSEIIMLSQAICLSVKDKFGIDIHPEVNFI